MKFVFNCRDRLEEKLQKFPAYFIEALLSSNILLVLCELDDNDTIAACGITGVSNYLVLYVEKGYRDRGIGAQILKVTIDAARKRGLSFVALAVSSNNTPAVHLYSKHGFRVFRFFRKFGFIVMMLPLTYKGELAYTFLHITCSTLPETVILHTIDFLMSVVRWIRSWHH